MRNYSSLATRHPSLVTRQVAGPEALHFRAGRQEDFERALGDSSARLQDDDPVGAAQSGPAVGDDQTGRAVSRPVLIAQHPFPKQALRLYVERTGQVVADE